ncbi:hypothetical protein AB0368_05615 [Actinoplanes sp. NPDC051475]|uniref:hypothetical protein n=1 Tax=Actinoplanes sp. NPDC051475 TaxID=3157225 RepID=UPI00344BC074
MTALGEAALGQLLVRVADYRTLLRLSEEQTCSDRGRHLRDAAVVRHGNALTDLVAVLESFTVARLLNLRPAISHNQVMKWTDRLKMWKNQGGVELTTFTHMQAVLGFVEVRNALEHGLGRLTERQLAQHRDAVLAYIAAAGVRLDGDRVLIAPEDVGRCSDVGGDFIRFLDLSAPKT